MPIWRVRREYDKLPIMNFGRVIRADCLNTPPPPDPRCDDPAFAVAFPEICLATPTLIIKPSVTLVCALGSMQFRAFYVKAGVETDVTAQCIFSSSNFDVAIVGAVSGNATGLTTGQAVITATYQGLTAQAELNVLGSNCCSDRNVAMMLVVDTSKSMSQSFGGAYATRLAYAKAAATRFINEVNQTKDTVGLMRFNAVDDVVLSSPISDKAGVAALVPGIVQAQQLTTFYDGLSTAVDTLAAATADLKVIVLISDGEDNTTSYLSNPNPIELLSDFKAQGGIVMCLGCRASGKGFNLLSAFATGGFFLNGYPAVAQSALDNLSGLKGYICAGNCTPAGDIMIASGALNYSSFINWDVETGNTSSVDLEGNGFFDVLPGNGLYVDLLGNPPSTPINPRLILKSPIALQAAHDYRIKVRLAGNNVGARTDSVIVRVYYIDGSGEHDIINQTVLLSDYTANFSDYSFAFSQAFAANAYISIQQANAPADGPLYSGVMLKRVTFDDVTDGETEFDDSFDGENIQYLPPACGLGTTYVQISGATSASFKNNSDAVTYEVGFSDNTSGSSKQYTVIPGETVQVAPDAYIHIWVIGDTDPVLVKAVTGGAAFIGTLTWNADLSGDTVPGTGNPSHLVEAAGASQFGYASGYNCYGEGCLDEPPGVQRADPNALPDIEQGFTPPKTYTATKTACVTCPAGSEKVGGPLIDALAGTDSHVTASSTGGRPAWQAFAGATGADISIPGWDSTHGGPFPQWIAYTFDTAVSLSSIGIRGASRIFPVTAPQGFNNLHFQFQGSNDGSTWTTLAEAVINNAAFGITENLYAISDQTSYKYFRLYFPNDATNTTGYAIIYRLQLYGVDSAQTCAEATDSSTVSQADADSKAYNAALALAQAALTCAQVFTSSQSYTAQCPTGTFGPSVTKSATASSFISQADADALALSTATDLANAELTCDLSNNDQPITINDFAPATPYPSVKHITGLTGHVTHVSVAIKKFTHTFPDDVHILLRAPDGTTCMLMRNCGGNFSVANLDIVFDDSAGSSLPDATILSSGTFKPTQIGGALALPLPAPQPAYGSTLSVFTGMTAATANGSWSLWVYDDQALNIGSIALGWDITITAA